MIYSILILDTMRLSHTGTRDEGRALTRLSDESGNVLISSSHRLKYRQVGVPFSVVNLCL